MSYEFYDYKCTNGHDLCHGGASAGADCPLCDRVPHGSGLISRAGPILFGEFWRAPFCAMFGINERNLRRMIGGEAPVPAGLLHDVEIALRDHGTELDNLLAEWP